jgi:hypothetical protein
MLEEFHKQEVHTAHSTQEIQLSTVLSFSPLLVAQHYLLFSEPRA